MKNSIAIIYFFALCLYALGCIGGTAYLFYDNHAVFGVSNILLGCMAFPTARKFFKKLNSDDHID